MVAKVDMSDMGIASRIEGLLAQRVGGATQSVVKYEPDGFEIAHLRDDVAEQYDESDIETVVDDARMASLTVPRQVDIFAEEHGDLTCLAACFENVIEMNFVLDDGEGVAVALDAEAFGAAHGLISDAREIVIEEREGE